MIAYLIIVVFAAHASYILASEGRWIPRLISIVALFTVGSVVFFLPGPDGLPTDSTPPETSRFAGCVVQEEQGLIYLWLTTESVPKGYRQPYTRALHEACKAASQAAAAGAPVGMRRIRATQGNIPGQRVPKHQFVPYRLPPSQPPTKE